MLRVLASTRQAYVHAMSTELIACHEAGTPVKDVLPRIYTENGVKNRGRFLRSFLSLTISYENNLFTI